MRDKVTEQDLKQFLKENPCTVYETSIIRKFVTFVNEEKPFIFNCHLCENLRKTIALRNKENENIKL